MSNVKTRIKRLEDAVKPPGPVYTLETLADGTLVYNGPRGRVILPPKDVESHLSQ
jgi:hypothetical protein